MTAPEPLPLVERTGVCLLDPAALPRSSWALDALLGIAAPPSLAPLLRWDAGPVSVSLVHHVPAGAVPLAAVLSGHALDLAHAVEVGVAVGTALQSLHDAGLAHGAVDGETVLVAPDGSVVLAGTGLAWRTAPGSLDGPRPDGDVAALGTLLRGLLGPRSAPAPLVVAALRATDPDITVRPTAADLVAAVLRCGDPAPLPVGGSAGPVPVQAPPVAPTASVPPRPTAGDRNGSQIRRREVDPASVPARRGPARVVRRVVVAVLLLAAGAVAVRAVPTGTAAAEPAPSAPVPAASSTAVPAPAETDWVAVLASLDEGRRRALESGSEDDLALWVDPTGEAWARDRALQRRLAGSAATLSGGALVLEEVVPEQVAADRAVLAVRDRRTAYDVVDGGRRTHVPERAARWWTVVLTAVPSLDGEGWRVAEVRGAPHPAAP